jgi:hypothetical protein
MLFGAALRGNRVLDGPFAATIVAAWKAAVTSNRRPIDQEAFLAGLEYAERLTSEEVGVKMPGPDTVLTYCKGLLARVATSPAGVLTGASRVAKKLVPADFGAERMKRKN